MSSDLERSTDVDDVVRSLDLVGESELLKNLPRHSVQVVLVVA